MISKFDISSSYTLDILKNLFKKGMIDNQCNDYLINVQKGNITEENREKLLTWIFDVWDELESTHYTKELACLFTDYVLKTKKWSKSGLQLLGISSIQIAIKLNEQFLVSAEALSNLCGGEYSNELILNFEKILLSQLGWCPYLPTSFEIVSHMKTYIFEKSLESNNNQNTNSVLHSLSEIFKSEEFTHKISIFIKIAILDYNLSRYGPIIVGFMASLYVLKWKNSSDEYSLFLQIILQIFQNEELPKVIFEAWKVTSDIFSLSETDSELTNLQDILGLTSKCSPNDDVISYMNDIMQSDSSQITNCMGCCSSTNISPNKIKFTEDDCSSNDKIFDAKKQKLYQKKRKIIHKR